MTNSSGRFQMWSITLRDAAANPLLGIGPMNYVCTSPVHMSHPHNFPLQLAAEWGIPVALAVCILFIVLLWRISVTIRRGSFGDPGDGILAGLLLTGVLAAALHACLSGVMVMPVSQVTGVLVCGMLLGLVPARGNEQPRTTPGWAGIAGLILCALLLVLGVHELRTLTERSVQLNVGEDLRPRIWQDAKVCRLYNRQLSVSN